MKIKAELKYLRIAPRKTRLVASLIKKKNIEQAQEILDFTVKRGAKPILKLLNSAAKSAENNFQLDPANLYVYKITVDEGPKFKRWRPRSRGMAYPIQKKTSHVTIVLDEIVAGKKLKKKPAVAKAAAGEERKEVKKEVKEKPKFKPQAKEEKKNRPAGRRKGLMNKIFRRKSF